MQLTEKTGTEVEPTAEEIVMLCPNNHCEPKNSDSTSQDHCSLSLCLFLAWPFA